MLVQNFSVQMHFLDDDEEKLCGSPGIPHIPGMMPVGFYGRTCQQRIMISLHEQIWIAGDSPDTASGVDGQDPHSEEPDKVKVLRPVREWRQDQRWPRRP